MWCSEHTELQHTLEFAEAAATAECVIVGTDTRSAFGIMHRSGAIRAVAKCCPALVGLVATSWGQGARLWARASNDGWEERVSWRDGALNEWRG